MIKDLNKTVRKGANKRCPFRNQCGKPCEHVGSELACSYYKYNACGDDIIEDQERIREIMEKAEIREREEALMDDMTEEEGSRLVMLPIDKLYPHPDNPRKSLGDLTELSESIKAKGVMQNLTVVPRAERDGTYTIIIGHRRHAAAKKAKLKELPCVIVEMSEQEQVATMLLENIQRSDLTAYEQAKGFQMMMDLGDSVKGIVDKTGFSESTVRRRLKMAELDEEVLKKVSSRQISFGDIDKLQEIEDLQTRNKVLADIGTANFNNSFRTAVEKEKKEKVLAELRKTFDAKGLKEVSWNEYREKYNYEHAIDATVKDLDDRLDDAIGKGVTAYYYSYATTFYLLTDKEAKVEKTPEQLAAEERERKRKQRYSLLESTFERLYQLRREFISNYSFKQAAINLDKIASYTLVCGINRDLCDEISKEDLWKLLFGKETVVSSYEEMCSEIAPTEAAKALLVAVWLLTDGDDLDCHDWYCRYGSDARLEMIYEFLESLGYEMSDEERELLDGTSELYEKGDE